MLAELGIPEKAVNSTDDIYIQNYFQYEIGEAKPIIWDRLSSAASFWEKDLKAPVNILSVIKYGYKIPFITEPPKMHFKNNRSATENLCFVDTAVKELLEFELIEIVKEKPHIISPLSVAKNAESKMRLILDLSIGNEYVESEKFSLEDQRDFYEFCKIGDHGFSFDIKSIT